MAWTLLKLKDKRKTWYLVWSSIVDAPITYGCTRLQARNLYLREFGQSCKYQLKGIFERADTTGVSSHHYDNIPSFISINRAGPDESELSLDEIVEFFCRRQKNPTQKELDKYRTKEKSSKGLTPQKP